jgi:SAM-dependent methyltransferase
MPQKAKNLVEQAHKAISSTLRPGDLAVDLTAGKGHDTLFIAKLVATSKKNGPSVLAVDIQPAAIEATRARLEAEEGLNASEVSCVLADHSGLDGTIATHYPQFLHQTACVVMNLGYLPGAGSDKTIVTTPDGTLHALRHSLQLLKPGGLLSVTAYKGHHGGHEEAEAVHEWFAAQQALNTLESTKCIHGSLTYEHSPQLLLGYRSGQD